MQKSEEITIMHRMPKKAKNANEAVDEKDAASA